MCFHVPQTWSLLFMFMTIANNECYVNLMGQLWGVFLCIVEKNHQDIKKFYCIYMPCGLIWGKCRAVGYGSISYLDVFSVCFIWRRTLLSIYTRGQYGMGDQSAKCIPKSTNQSYVITHSKNSGSLLLSCWTDFKEHENILTAKCHLWALKWHTQMIDNVQFGKHGEVDAV